MKRSFFYDLASFFALYGIVFIPFAFYLSNVQTKITGIVFGKLIGSISANLFGRTLADNRIYSDSFSMYVLVLILFFFALITVLLLRNWKKWEGHRLRVTGFIYKFCCYYLALILLKYGVDKIFKNQFYLPEPNTLHTPLGQLDKDILYWSSMGTSHFYSVFMGALEMIAALFLFFRRSRLTGLLISLVVMLNVLAVNFGFDIGVKLFSLFLLFLTLYLLAPYAKRLYLFLTQQTVVPSTGQIPENKTFLFAFLKWFVIGLIFIEAFYPFIRAGNFNGDKVERPFLHGAYEVQEVIKGADTLSSAAFPFKRVFVHKDDYMIFQDQQDLMRDYKLTHGTGGNNITFLTDYQMNRIPLILSYNKQDSLLLLEFSKDGQPLRVKAKTIDWRQLPALKKSFHWTAD